MSSKHLTILPALAALLLTASCSNDDVDGLFADGPVAAQVTADIYNGKSISRASTAASGYRSTFSEGDVIHVVAAGTDTYDYSLVSVDADTETQTWSAVTAPYYFENFNTVSFQGWYSTTESTDNSINIDTKSQNTDEEGWNEWDILVSPAVSASTLSPLISFTEGEDGTDNRFKHVMSEMTLVFQVGTGVDDLSALTGYKVENLITDATFDALTCGLTAGSDINDISMTLEVTEGTEEVTSPIIVVPQDVTDGTIPLEVYYNGQTYTTDLPLPDNKTALEAGLNNWYTIKVNNTGLTIGSATIEAWTTVEEQDGEATLSSTDYAYTTDDSGVRSYTVYSEIGLQGWAEYVLEGNYSANCTLETDITLTTVDEGESNWTAFGSSTNPYTGTFDGNGHTIDGLTIADTDGSDNQGLIGYLGSEGVVKDLTLTEVSISSEDGRNAGGVVGYNNGTVVNCSVSGTVSSLCETGGVVGCNSGTVTACSASGTVSGVEDVGGVVGWNSQGVITACYSTVDVSGTYGTGGIVGWNTGTVIACYSTGDVSCESSDKSDYTGGVAGYNVSSATVTACYWSGDITSGIGVDKEGSGETTYVDGTDVTWSSAAETMNTALISSGWQYEVTSSDPPLTLVAQ